MKGARRAFLLAWFVLLVAKAWLAAALPVFGDEAFYLQEGRHLAWAYSDLPGLTAWLTRLGSEVAGGGAFGFRWPFLLLGAAMPWVVVRIARRWFGARAGWQAGLLALLMPLGGLLGVLAVPDVPMVLAALVCLDAVTMMLRDGGRGAAPWWLALALVTGALAHYRFAAVVAAGAAGLACAPAGRALLRERRLWLALALGALGWVPLLAWNLAHGGAGLDFQFVDRHPWSPQATGLGWLPLQALLLTPPLSVLLLATLVTAWRRRREAPWGLLAGTAGVATLGWFVLGVFADQTRVSFHWPLAGWLALAAAAPVVLARWRPWAARLVIATAAAGCAALFAYAAALSMPPARAWLAGTPAYADNFSGWDEVAAAVRERLATAPAGTRVVADNFMLGAQLSRALGRDDIAVLPHPLNDKHGRARQLRAWGLESAGAAASGGAPRLLVAEESAWPLKQRLAARLGLCALAGPLGEPAVVAVDHGRKRFLVWQLPADRAAGCQLPALAWIDTPLPAARASGGLVVTGWAMKPGAGLATVEVLIDGEVAARAAYGEPRPDVLDYWGRTGSGDDPGVGFRASLDLRGLPPGRHRLALRLTGHDGRVEDWPPQWLVVGG